MKHAQGFKKPVCIAGANQETVQKALEGTKGTTIGVMDSKEIGITVDVLTADLSSNIKTCI